MLYFAYGSNLNHFQMKKRCKDCSFIKKYEIIKECHHKAHHYINLASNSLSIFKDCKEKTTLENLTSFSLSRDF